MPKYERQNSHFIKISDEGFRFEEPERSNKSGVSMEDLIKSLESVKKKEKDKTQKIAQLERLPKPLIIPYFMLQYIS